MQSLDLHNKRVLIREDLNVPLEASVIQNDQRILAALPTLRAALNQGAAVLVMSHLGRPTEGEFDSSLSLQPVAERLSELLGKPVPLLADWPHCDTSSLQPGEIALCENVRFCVGEKTDDETLAKAMAAHCDVLVLDAFATAHRAQASTHAVAKFAAAVCAGPLLEAELAALDKVLAAPASPVVAIVGGAKISTKLPLLASLLDKVDSLIVGGGIANTFLAAQGVEVGASLYEPDLLEQAKTLLKQAAAKDVTIVLPQDAVVAEEVTAEAEVREVELAAVQPSDRILDVGVKSQQYYAEILQQAGTILWNGPVGLFELAPFAAGTKALAKAIAFSQAYSVAGGGDTVAAIDQFGVQDHINYISTGGGAFLAYLQGEELPSVAVLSE